MKQTNFPRKNALRLSLLILLVYSLGIVIMYFLEIIQNLIWFSGMGLILFFTVYFSFYFGFLTFVKEMLDPVYKTLGKEMNSRKELINKFRTNTLSNEISNEISVWANDKTNELRQLKEMEKYRRDFLGNVSHELKTPIFNIQGYILTLLDGGINDESINTLYLQRAEKSVNRMVSIVDDLVSISRLESGEFKLDIETFNIVKLVEDVFESYELMSKKYKVKLEFDKNYNKGIKVKGDRKRITEVLNNLLLNSIIYGKANGKTKVGFTENKKNILIEVSDNGIGISEDDLPRIFERFYRVDKSRSRDSGGTGLGLSIVKHVLLAHKQSINVQSVVNKGTTFAFTLDKA